MTAAPEKTAEKFSGKAFVQGLVAVVAIYLGIFTYIALQADKTLKKLEDQFPFKVVLIERPPEAYVYPPAPTAGAETFYQPTPASQRATDSAPVDVPMGPLQAAPFPGLYEVKDGARLPKISEAGVTPFEAYKRPFAWLGTPVISIAVRDYGLSVGDSDQALALPPEVTLIVSPYAENPELWQQKAREAGHEVWLSIPMENARFLVDDPGPEALLSHASLPDNQVRLDRMLGSMTGYAGIIGETDKAFLDMHAMLGELIKSVFQRGLGYVEMNPAGSEFLETIAVGNNAPFTSIDENGSIYHDNDLQRLESTARQKGVMAVTVALLPKNIEAIKTWLIGLNSRGVSLAPLSAIASGKVPKKQTQTAVPPPAETAPPAVPPPPPAVPAPSAPPME